MFLNNELPMNTTLINFYKRYVSPHKGFKCARGVHTGESCSTRVKILLEPLPWYDLTSAWKVYRQTTNECKHYYIELKEKRKGKKQLDCLECGCDMANLNVSMCNKCNIESCD